MLENTLVHFILIDADVADWAPYAHDIDCISRTETLAAQLERCCSDFEDKARWVFLVKEDETPRGDPQKFKETLQGIVASFTHDTQLVDVPFSICFSGERRGFFVPKGLKWQDCWVWVDGEEAPRNKRPTAKLYYADFPSEVLEIVPPKKEAELEKPFLSLCVIFRNADEGLSRMLESTRGQVDEYVLVCTTDEPLDFDFPAAGASVVFSRFQSPCPVLFGNGEECIGDFADARNYAFGLASGEWRMFLDADDTLEWQGALPPGNLRKSLKIQCVNANRVAYSYKYADDLTQLRHCAWRWLDDKGRPLWIWEGPVHERVEPTEWNEGEKTMSFQLPGEVFYIHHHGLEDETHAKYALERNYLIAKQALETGNFTPRSEARLVHTMATQDLDRGDPRGEYGLMRIVEEFKQDPYALLSMLTLAALFISRRQFEEARSLLVNHIDYWREVPEIPLYLARAFDVEGRKGHACQWYVGAYRIAQNKERPEYRTVVEDLEFMGRLDAAECFIECKLYEQAVEVLELAPPKIGQRPKVLELLREARNLQSDAQAAAAVQTLGHYLLSLDCVDRATELSRLLPSRLRRAEQAAELDSFLEKRLRHIEEPSLYKEGYDVLNESDLVEGARVHMPPLLERIIEHKPTLFVDIGCNTGWMALQVAKALPECYVIGLDASPARIGECRKRRDAYEMDPDEVQFQVCSLGKWGPYVHRLEEKVVVLCSEVLEHVPSDWYFLDTVLTEDHVDHLLITVPDEESYSTLVPRARRLGVSRVRNAGTLAEGFEHVRCYDAHSLVAALEMHDMVPERIERLNLSPLEGADDRRLLFADCRLMEDHWFNSEDAESRIDIYAEGYINWGPDAHREGHAGGSEQAVIHLAPRLQKLGFDVHVYASPMERLGYEQGVHWHHIEEFRPNADRYALIGWRSPEKLREFKEAARGRYPVCIWSHDVPMPEYISQYNCADQIWVLSQYHKQLFIDGGISEEKLVVLQNGVDADLIREIREQNPKKEPHSIFYGSSVDRGLLQLLRMWPEIRVNVPDAKLFATYRRDLLRHPAAGELKHKIADEVERLAFEYKDLGVTLYDGLKHREYLELAASCQIWASPHTFPEISCIVAMEMQALGVECVTTDFAALKETLIEAEESLRIISWSTMEQDLKSRGATSGDAWWFGEGVYSSYFCDILTGALTYPRAPADLYKLSARALSLYDWNRTAELFRDAIEGATDGNQFREQRES